MKMTHQQFVDKLSGLIQEASAGETPFDGIVSALEITKFVIIKNQMEFQHRATMEKLAQQMVAAVPPPEESKIIKLN